ncbi:MAG: HEAT repeat domain-containing protein [Candidatus Lokiarchaeota archaeon]|nr:HEAT repeat domain-containing protein [Candidatus Lokiarchaeota archaeon]
MVVIAMAFIFAVKTPEFWQESSLTPPDINPLSLLLPFAFCLVYISIYPLIDFLFIALSSESDEGLTPFHRFIGNKIINVSKSRIISVIMAFILYFLFIVPPLLISLTGLPFLMIWISWLLVYPLMILTFYGSKGYIAGISNEFYHIPDIKRSVFLNFEDSKRGMKQFASNPKPYVMLGLMLFVFVWAWISLFQTIIFFFSGSLAISTMTSYFVFVTLLFGIIGYFTRFWGRKIKYRGIDIYFAAYLMAAIGINVLVNFLIVNIEKLTETFNFWTLTINISPNYIMFAWAAVIEEIFMLTFTTYYFLSKNNEFTRNLKYSKITDYGQNFDAIPLFNLIKSSNPKLRKHAENTLLMMYERIPLKSDLSLNDRKFKNSLLDGLCDSNPSSRDISYKILTQLEKDVPNVVLPWIIESLESPNYDKSIPIAKSLLDANDNLIKKIPVSVVNNLISDSEWRIKLTGIKIIKRLSYIERGVIHNLDLLRLINDPNSTIQVELLNILAESSLDIPIEVYLDKINHRNKDIRAAAIRNIKNINTEQIDLSLINTIIPLMSDANSSVRASVFEVISKIGNFKKLSIPFSPIFDGLLDPDDNVRKCSVLALDKYYSEEPNSVDIDKIISKIDSQNPKAINSIISLLGKLWENNPEKILTTFLIFIKFDNLELKERISNSIVENFNKNPSLILDNLIRVKDEAKYISKGIISKTIIKISKEYPNDVIPKLIENLNLDDKDVKLNIISSLDGLIEDYIDLINLNSIIKLFRDDDYKEVKKGASQLISEISRIKPLALKPVLEELLQLLPKQDLSVRITLTKSMLEISKRIPDMISIPLTINFLSDSDSFIRETSVKILGYIGSKLPIVAIDALINRGLNDEEWIVREATVESLGKLFQYVENQGELIKKLVMLLDDDKIWVRRSSMNLLSSIKEISASQLPLKKISEILLNEDSKIRESAVKLLKIHSFDNIDKMFDNILSLLGDESEGVRDTTVDVMVSIIQKIGISKILSKLLRNLSDESTIETQQSIATILGRTVRYEEDIIKKRVISLLKIRCEMSQDPIICEVLTKLKGS